MSIEVVVCSVMFIVVVFYRVEVYSYCGQQGLLFIHTVCTAAILKTCSFRVFVKCESLLEELSIYESSDLC